MMPKLNDWAIVATGTPYTAPEAMAVRLSGYIYDDKRFTDGTHVTTSRLATLSPADEKGNRTATTASGTVYALGTPRADFIAWLAENGKTLDDYVK